MEHDSARLSKCPARRRLPTTRGSQHRASSVPCLKKTTTLRHFQGFQIGYHCNDDSGVTSIKNKDRINRRLFYVLTNDKLDNFGQQGFEDRDLAGVKLPGGLDLLPTGHSWASSTHSLKGRHTHTHETRATDNCAPGTIFVCTALLLHMFTRTHAQWNTSLYMCAS